VLGMLGCAAFMVFFSPWTWILFVFWLGLGFIVYANYGMKRGRANR